MCRCKKALCSFPTLLFHHPHPSSNNAPTMPLQIHPRPLNIVISALKRLTPTMRFPPFNQSIAEMT